MIDKSIILCYNKFVDIHKMSFIIDEEIIMDKGIGIIKEIDKLGRLVIPKEYRERLNIDSQVELLITQNGVLIRNPEYILVKKDNAADKSKSGTDLLKEKVND